MVAVGHAKKGRRKSLSMSGYVLLTGATGLLGQYLVRDLLAAGHRLALLIRGNLKATPLERMEGILQLWETRLETTLPRPLCIEADITKEGLGISPEDNDWINRHCSRMIHSAASLQFREETSTGEPYRTNVEGTRNVIRWLAQSRIRGLHYISTAYVCGRRDDLVMEDELDTGQEFRNDYERSKFQAEKMVREASFLDQLTVYRPVVITGDSETGYTSTYHGSYLYMKLAALLARNTDADENGNRHLPIRWGLTGDERRNITPVEWNSKVITRLFDTPEAHGRTFQMPPRKPTTMRQVIEFGTKYFNITGIEFAGYGFQDPNPPLTDLERLVWSSIEIYRAYDFKDPQFDQTNLRQFVPDVPCPELDNDVTQRLIAYAEADRWGKRRPDPLVMAADTIASRLAPYVDQTSETGDDSNNVTNVSLDLSGPGGGQWKIQLVDDQLVKAARGLAERHQPTLRMSMQEFNQINGDLQSIQVRIAKYLSIPAGDSNGLASQLAQAIFSEAVESTT